MPTLLEDYLFDLQGYLILKQALTSAEVAAMNQAIDDLPLVEPGDWHGHVQRQDHHPKRGLNWQNIVEGGEPFEALIDHPSWIAHARHYVGEADGLFIDECFASIRGPGESINLHSGGHERKIRTQFRYHDGQFRCGQINVLVALTDIGPGDGATVVIPGSHKSNLVHPHVDRPYEELVGQSADGVEGACEVHMAAGDAILFVDCLAHGSAARVKEGERRIVVYRYGPSWGFTRFGYLPSAELLERLTPARRKILQPIPPRTPAGDGSASGG